LRLLLGADGNGFGGIPFEQPVGIVIGKLRAAARHEEQCEGKKQGKAFHDLITGCCSLRTGKRMVPLWWTRDNWTGADKSMQLAWDLPCILG
jgi:hypothetical protein